jgi:nucleoside-diphosphate-sugar epimerase
MRIFLTGATGHVGSVVLDGLVRAGHEVTALVRTADKARQVAKRGGRPVNGDLSEPASYRDVAEAHDAYVHTARDRSNRTAEIDQLAVETLAELVRKPRTGGNGRVLIYTSALWVLGKVPDPADENAPVNPTPLMAWRPAVETFVLGQARAGLRTIVVRPGVVYGGTHGIVADLLRDAGNGLIRVIGDGQNHWPLVYDRDVAELYVRLVGRAEAAGIYHANDEGDERVNDIVDAIRSHMPMRPDVRHMPIEEARAKMGPYADALALDQIVRSTRAHALGWVPSLHSVRRNIARLLEEFRAGRDDREQAGRRERVRR